LLNFLTAGKTVAQPLQNPNDAGWVLATQEEFPGRFGPQVHLIFWLPAGDPTHDVLAPVTPNNPNGNDTFEAIIEQFFIDFNLSDYAAILFQYTGPCLGITVVQFLPCSPGLAVAGGMWVDTTAFPQLPLQDTDIQASVQRALQNNSDWRSGLGDEYFVFLGQNVTVCNPNGLCSGQLMCAYHYYFLLNPNDANSEIIYSGMPQVLSTANCNVGFIKSSATIYHSGLKVNYSPTDGETPNQVDADYELLVLSHEFFESLTDPVLNAWLDQTTLSEIGDLCSWMVGDSLGADGSNVSLHGHPYLVQEMWSNQASQCSLK
jgi:hypothetical protein